MTDLLKEIRDYHDRTGVTITYVTEQRSRSGKHHLEHRVFVYGLSGSELTHSLATTDIDSMIAFIKGL